MIRWLVVAAMAFTATRAPAAVPRQRAPIPEPIAALPAAGIDRTLRVQRQVRLDGDSPAWRTFAARAGGSWRASWDAATGVPNRIWGSGIAAPGASASPVIAEAIARRLLAEHLALLAPGASIDDFQLVANHSDGDVRAIGFVQRAGGLRVVGGQISFRIKRDRVVAIASEALPDVATSVLRARLPPTQLAARAIDRVRTALALPRAPVAPAGTEVVLPLVADDGVLGYRVAAPFTVDGGADGKYLAYCDPATGDPLAVHLLTSFATGTVLYRGVDRHPGRGRLDRPAPRAHVTLNDVAQTTSLLGVVAWTPEVGQALTTAVVGDLVTIVNKSGDLASARLAIAPGGQAIWDASGNGETDAQVVTYLAVNTVKEYIRQHLDPAAPKLGDPIVANVNLDQSCNAFYDGEAINFFRASGACQNTGLLEDVVYHEYGHALHHNVIIEGVGSFEGAMSEGASDFLAASVTGDPGMGRGFFYDDEALRDLDPAGAEAVWPRDVGEVHRTGEIFGGVFWDLRKALIAELGEAPGIALVNRLFMAALRRSTSIPSSLVEVLVADDDDGNLANGTPHECAIRDAFGRHGLRTATGVASAASILNVDPTTTPVRIDLSGLTACPGDAIDRVTLIWVPGFSTANTPIAGTAVMTPLGGGAYAAQLPLPTESSVRYSAKVQFTDGSQLTVADNLGDPFYTLYNGPTEVLYCTSFDSDPFADGWRTTAFFDKDREEVESPWAWGAPTGGPTDPPAAFTGANVLAQNLAGNYPDKTQSTVYLPPIDIGQWSDVHLQFRRWLAVEDSQFDQARIYVGNRLAWQNSTAGRGSSSIQHHVDREWRFTDVRVSGVDFGHTLKISFDLKSDGGLAFGGWAIDDLCVVANVNSICGDGIQSAAEGCDDGDVNANKPDRCRTYCRLPTCGDAIRDMKEACDDGPAGSARCSDRCQVLVPEDEGCCSTSGGAPSSLVWAAVVGFALRRRRRATSARPA